MAMAASSKVEASLRGRTIHLHVRLPGASGLMGWQLYDPKESLFLSEGNWMPLEDGGAELEIQLPEQDGPYRVYVSPVDEQRGWEYARGREPDTSPASFAWNAGGPNCPICLPARSAPCARTAR